MPYRCLSAILLGSLVSCEKATEVAESAAAVVRDELLERTKKPAKVDEGLQKLVDQTDEGVMFRKDVKFPGRLEVRVVRRLEMDGRRFESSAIEKRRDAVLGTQSETVRFERAGSQVRYILEQSGFAVPDPKEPKKQKPVANPLQPSGPSRSVTFRHLGSGWKIDDSDGFHSRMLAERLLPGMDVLMLNDAVSPRPLWFAKRRMAPGDELTIAGDSLGMLVAGDATGELKLKLESLEPVEGHPCAIFTVSGTYHRKQIPDFDGNVKDEDVDIQSGRLWLSLIYPIVLREELDTIQTLASNSAGLSKRFQGKIKVLVTRRWKIIEP